MSVETLDAKQTALAAAVELGKDGMFLDALEQLQSAGTLQDWYGAARTEVAWLVVELGAPRLCRWHILKAWREEPDSLLVRNAYGQLIAEENGPLETLEFIEQASEPTTDDDAEERMRWLWLKASTFTHLRDFSEAEKFIKQMDAIDARPDIARFVRAFWLERQDRYDDALQAIDQALQIRAVRRTVAYKAHLLTLVGQDDAANQLLTQFDQVKQIASLSWQMSAIAYERRDYPECARLLARFESLSPLLERTFGDRFTMFRCEVARRMGDDEQAIDYARRSKSAYGKKIAERLADPERRQRIDKVLPVEFVRQHELTCGPATLSALSRYWGRRAEHLEVAEEICYNGTTNHAERKWANQNGYVTREFTVDEPSTEILISRDLPFTLVTRGAGYAHLQAVIGYDGRTGTILIRDPFHRVRGTAPADELLEAQAAHGPRGMVLVPADRAELLADLELPDAGLYDLVHALDGALIEHDREQAIVLLGQLSEQAPEHRLHWQTRRQFAIYDGDEQGILHAVQKLIGLYPDDVSLQMSELSLLGSLGRTDERIKRLRELASKPQSNPLFKLQLAESLALDGRYRDEAYKLLREMIRAAGTHARAYLELGDLLWQRYERDRALRMYRFAACLDDKDEFLASRYFDASVALRRTDEALDWLRNRFERFGNLSMQPAVTLQYALSRLRRHDEGIAVLETAMKLRPKDTELVLSVVQSLATTSGEYWPRAEALLESVRDTASERGWHETASQLAVMRGDWKTGLQYLETLLPRSPLSMSLRERITELLAEIDGEDAAIEHWRAAAEAFPHYLPLLERHATALRGRPLEFVQPVLEKILEQNPDNAWAERELAQHLLAAGKLDEAETRITRAAELDDEHSFEIGLQATLDSRRGNNASARSRLRNSLARDINDEYAVSRLLGFCDSVEEQQAELNWVLSELRRQPITGDVLLVYRDLAEAIVPADELLQTLNDAVTARPDLWPAHQTKIRQLTQMQRLDEATAAADAATKQFPLEPNSWFEQYRVAVAVGDAELQRTTLERCRLLRPSNPTVIRALSDVLGGQGKFAEAREMLQSLVSQQPLNAVNRGYLADVLIELGEKTAALEEFVNAVRLEPEYEFAWGRLDGIARELERPQERWMLAQRMTEEKPHVAGSWVQYSRSLGVEERFDEALQALENAAAIDPYREAIHIDRARLHVHSGNFEAAMKALQPEVYATIPPGLDVARAQLLWDIGEQDKAYELVLQTAEENPAATGIWHRLEQWAMIRNDNEQAIKAVEHQMRLQPHDPDVLDAAGHTFSQLNDKPKAIEAFRRAIEIAPGYAGSRCILFDLLVEQDNWSGAAAIMRDLPRCDQHPTVIARRMKVSMHEGDLVQANSDLEAILTSDEWSTWAVDRAVEMMVEANQRGPTLERIERGLAEKGNRDFGRVWTNLKLQETDVPEKRRFEQIAERIKQWFKEFPEAGQSAISSLLRELTKPKMGKHLKRFVATHQDWLRQNTHGWSVVAYAYAENPTAVGKSHMRRWVENWQQRKDYQPWMLTNVHELCRLVGDHAGGREAVEVGLTMPADHMQSQLRLWAAHDALVRGDSHLALRHFMSAERLENLQGFERLMHHWIEAVLHTVQTTDKQATFEQVRKQLDDVGVEPDFFTKQPVYRPVYVQAVRMIARATGTMKAKWWAVSKIGVIRLVFG